MVTVYLVDDDKEVLDFYTNALTLVGYHVERGENVDDAFKYLEKNVPDCIVSDDNMHGRHGLEILYYIKSRDLDRVGFVMTTGGHNSDISDKVIMFHGEFLSKPVCAEDIINAVKKQISLHQQR